MIEQSEPPSAKNLLRFFDTVYLLNLPERTDRLRGAMAQLTAVDDEAERYVRVYAGTRSAETHGFPSPGAYGCFQGHLGILRAARAAGAENVLVLEDDVRFLPGMKTDWPGIAEDLRTASWAIVNLGFDDTASPQVAGPNRLVFTQEALMLAHCYAVNGAALPHLIAFLEELQARPYGDPAGGPMHYDGALYHFCMAHPEFPRLRPVRSLAGQRSSRSDIAEGQWFDRNAITRPLAGMLRSLRERV